MKTTLQQYLRVVALFVLILSSSAAAVAQNFPVRASVTIVNPSPYLEDYGRDGNVLVILTLVDDRDVYDGLLRLSIAGNGYTATTRMEQFSRPIRLRRGQPLILRGPQLAPYFSLANLQVTGSGIDNTLANGGALPDGPIMITAEFFDVNRFSDAPVSNTAMATRFIQQNYPPELVLPFGEQLTSQVVNFAWNPRHLPQPGKDVYFLEIWEKQYGLTYDQVALSTPPVRPAIRTAVPRYVFTNYDARLQEGREYIYRIRVADVMSNRRFINGGYSAFGEFSIAYPPGRDNESTEGCPNASRLFAQSLGDGRGIVTWTVDEPERAESYRVRVRDFDSKEWTEYLKIDLRTDEQPLENLALDTKYEVEFCVMCPDKVTQCRITTFTTDPLDCGPVIVPTTTPVAETEMLLTWQRNDAVTGYEIEWTPLTVNSTGGKPGSQEEGGRAPSRGESNGDFAPGGKGGAVASTNYGTPRADSLILQAGASDAMMTGLVPGTQYDVSFCKICEDGSRECYSWILDFQGVNDACLADVAFTYTDSTATTLDLAWRYQRGAEAPSDSFDLVWQVSDESYEADTARVAYSAGRYQITGLLSGLVYKIKVCAECVTNQRVCRDLRPFGGCPSLYEPELVAANQTRVLLGYGTELDSVRAADIRYRSVVFPWTVNINFDSLTTFDAADYPVAPERLAETNQLIPYMVWQAELRTRCADTIWSSWSAPLDFSLACMITDSLDVNDLGDTYAVITKDPAANALYYQFEYRLAGGSWVRVDSLTAPRLALNNLSRETNYEVRMRYWCSRLVWSNWSPVLPFQTLPYCGPPTNDRVSDITQNSYALAFSKGTNAIATTIHYRDAAAVTGELTDPGINGRGGEDAGGPPRTNTVQAPSPWRQQTVFEDSTILQYLTPGTLQEYRLSSVCAVNESDTMAIKDVELDCVIPEIYADQIDKFSAQLTNLSSTSMLGRNSFEYRKRGDTTWVATRTQTGPFFTLRGLEDYTDYEARGFSGCPGGQISEPSAPVYFRTLVDCRVPTELGVTNLTNNRMSVRWDVTGTVEQWEILILEDAGMTRRAATSASELTTAGGDTPGGTAPTSTAPSGTAPSSAPPRDSYRGSGWKRYLTSNPYFTFYGLNPATRYIVVVRARCPSFGWTDYSPELQVRTNCDPKGPDNLNVTLASITETSATLNWDALRSCALDYEVEVSEFVGVPNAQATSSSMLVQMTMAGGGSPNSGTPTGATVATNTSSNQTPAVLKTETTVGTSYTVTGLKPNTRYSFRVRPNLEHGAFLPAQRGYTMVQDMGAAAGAEVKGTPGYGSYSPAKEFRSEECKPPVNVRMYQASRSSMDLSWAENRGPNTYKVDLRPLIDGGVMTSQTVNTPYITLENLTQNVEYEYRVSEVCNGGVNIRPGRKDTLMVGRVSRNNGMYVCGINNSIDLTNQIAQTQLRRGDIVKAYDFDVKIMTATKTGDRWTGTGEIQVPYFNAAKATLTFDTVFINTDNKMALGYMLVTGFGIEVLPPWADELLATSMQMLSNIDTMLQNQQVGQLDSIMLCCSEYLPIALQDSIQAVIDCYDDNPTDPAAAGCTARLDSLMVYINDALNDVSQNMDTMIIEAAAMEIIREAADSLAQIHASILADTTVAYDAAVASFGQRFQTLPPPNQQRNYLNDAIVVPVPPASGNNSSNSMNSYGADVQEVRRLAVSRVHQELYVNSSRKLPQQTRLREYARVNRAGDADVFQVIRDAVEQSWFDTANPRSYDRSALREQAATLLKAKYNFLSYD
ncbi:hypothetical protein [Lewinella sp. 4G2]|uniref:fibronectin type III domain-containing protein n=1 Tax=Lewinella sp. 4G2 TaxID=1803372 RepID=UPI0007B4E416|nr:hypothetical protein [Lewinella sp. 4G2]OAV43829.1 hypothetical protein A3850_004640 [Lewinella sp. 4G2]